MGHMKELFNLPPLVLKARCVAFCWVSIGLPEQALGWFPPIGLGLVMEDRPTGLSCMHTHSMV